MIQASSTMQNRARRFAREAKRTSGWGGLLYIVPALFLLVLFEIWPIIFGAWISLWKWDIRPVEFVGIDNFRRIFADEIITRNYNDDLVPGEVAHSLIITIYYALGTVPVTILIAFVLAYSLFQKVPGRSTLRTAYFLPYVTNSVAITLVFAWIFDPTVGVANALLDAIGLPTQTWLEDPTPALAKFLTWIGIPGVSNVPELAMGPSMALLVVIMFSIWTLVGFNIVVLLAGLTSIPNDIVDAARLDGASSFRIMRSIIWPLLSPSTFFLLIFNTIGAFQAFTPIYTLTRGSGASGGEVGGPLDTTLTITVYIFRNFYERSNSVGYAAAVSFVLFFILLALTLIQFRVLAKRVHYQ